MSTESDQYSEDSYDDYADSYDDDDDENDDADEEKQQPTQARGTSSPPRPPTAETRSPLLGVRRLTNESRTSGSRRATHDVLPGPNAVVVGQADTVDLGLTDEQQEVFRQRRGRWDMIARDKRIRLVAVAEALLERWPMSEYELFCTGRGRYADLVTNSCQTGDNVEHQDCQTMPTLAAAACAQAPQDLKETMRAAAATRTAAARSAALAGQHLTTAGDAPSASAAAAVPGLATSGGALTPPAALGRRTVRAVALSSTLQPLAAVAYTAPATSPDQRDPGAAFIAVGAGSADPPADRLSCAQGVVLVWDLSSPKAPAYVLIAEAPVSCVCWGPSTAPAVVLAGAEDGSIVVWDLRETDRLHHCAATADGSAKLVLRAPTYTTAHLAGATAAIAAFGAVVSVVALPESVGETAAADSVANDGGGSRTLEKAEAFTVLSASEWGTVSAWTVLVGGLAGDENGGARAGMNADDGLRTGGCVRMVRTRTSVSCGDQTSHNPSDGLERRCKALAWCPDPAGPCVLAACDHGHVLKGALYGDAMPPKVLRSAEANVRAGLGDEALSAALHSFAATCAVLAVAPHPQLADLVLAGLDTGAIVLHSISASRALHAWHGAPDLVTLAWHPRIGTAFVAVFRDGSVVLRDAVREPEASGASSTRAVKLPGAKVTAAAVSTLDTRLAARASALLVAGRRDGTVSFHVLDGAEAGAHADTVATSAVNVLRAQWLLGGAPKPR